MPQPKSILARHLFEFRDVVGDRHVVATTVGADLNPVVLSLGKSPDYRVEKRGASFPKKKADEPNDYRIHYSLDGQWLTVDIEPTYRNIHAVQPLGPEQWLLVCCRASSPADRNADVADCYGRIIHSFHAGDGIEDVQATADAKIWCSFFDEGVFGDVETGRSGLVCFDSQGNKLFNYGQIAGQNNEIADCYALNVSGNQEVWLYYYTDFPLVRISSFELANRWPRMPVSGSHAFAVAKNQVLFFGCYKDRHRLFQVNLSTLRVQKLIATAEGGAAIKAASAFGRGHTLFLMAGSSLFSVVLQP